MQALSEFLGESRVYHAMSLHGILDETIMSNAVSHLQKAIVPCLRMHWTRRGERNLVIDIASEPQRRLPKRKRQTCFPISAASGHHCSMVTMVCRIISDGQLCRFQLDGQLQRDIQVWMTVD